MTPKEGRGEALVDKGRRTKGTWRKRQAEAQTRKSTKSEKEVFEGWLYQ